MCGRVHDEHGSNGDDARESMRSSTRGDVFKQSCIRLPPTEMWFDPRERRWYVEACKGGQMVECREPKAVEAARLVDGYRERGLR